MAFVNAGSDWRVFVCYVPQSIPDAAAYHDGINKVAAWKSLLRSGRRYHNVRGDRGSGTLRPRLDTQAVPGV